MSDFKDLFRTAAAQRAANVPTKEQIRALKAQKNAVRERPTQAQAVEAPIVSSSPSAVPSSSRPASTAASDRHGAALPQGFFSDKIADAKARGVKIPDEKDKEDEFKQFQRMMDDQIKDIAAKEAEEAEEDAEYREEREAFEQSTRLQLLDSLRRRQAGQGGPSKVHAAEAVVPLTLPKRKRRVIDVLQEQLADSEGDTGSEGGEDLVLDWRAKGV